MVQHNHLEDSINSRRAILPDYRLVHEDGSRQVDVPVVSEVDYCCQCKVSRSAKVVTDGEFAEADADVDHVAQA